MLEFMFNLSKKEEEGFLIYSGSSKNISRYVGKNVSFPTICKSQDKRFKGVIMMPEEFCCEGDEIYDFVLYHEMGHVEKYMPKIRLFRRESVADNYAYSRCEGLSTIRTYCKFLKRVKEKQGHLMFAIISLTNLNRLFNAAFQTIR